MSLKTLRQIFKSCGDDTRLRILNLLKGRELPVTKICSSLNISQPTISKHLARLRLLRIVIDRREGNSVYYRLNTNVDSPQGKIVTFIVSQFQDLQTFKRDKEVIEKEERKEVGLPTK